MMLVKDGGEIKSIRDYDVSGEMLNQAPRDRDPFGFIGGIDGGNGLWKLGARFYDSNRNSFIQQDRYMGDVSDPLSLNRYVYCRLDPMNYIDPTGFDVMAPGRDLGSDHDGYDSVDVSENGNTTTVTVTAPSGSRTVTTTVYDSNANPTARYNYNYSADGKFQGGTITYYKTTFDKEKFGNEVKDFIYNWGSLFGAGFKIGVDLMDQMKEGRFFDKKDFANTIKEAVGIIGGPFAAGFKYIVH